MIDPSDRVLLIRHSFPDWTGWLLPGGGVEDHENQRTALLRELAEEVGPPAVFLGPPVWHRRRLSPNRRDGYDGQEETVYLVPCHEFEIAPTMTPAELEADGIVEHRWWSADELAETEEGSRILLSEIGGMQELNDRSFVVELVAGQPDQVKLVGANSSEYGVYTSGGIATFTPIIADRAVDGATVTGDTVLLTFSEDHGYATGARVFIDGMEGMTELNGRAFEVVRVDEFTLQITVDDGSVLGAYTGGGVVKSSTRLFLNAAFDTADGESEGQIEGFTISAESPTLFVDESTQIDVLFVHDEDSPADSSGVLTSSRLYGLNMGPDLVIAGELRPGGITYNDLEVVDIDLGVGNNALTVLGTHTRADDPDTTEDESLYRTWTFINTGDEPNQILSSGTISAAAGTGTTVSDAALNDGAVAGRFIKIVKDGAGNASAEGQVRRIVSNFGGVLTLDRAWDVDPAGEAYEIFNGDRVDVRLQQDASSITGTITSAENAEDNDELRNTITIDGTYEDNALSGQTIRIVLGESTIVERRVISNVNNVLWVDNAWENPETLAGEEYTLLKAGDGAFALNLQGGNDFVDASASTAPIIVFGGSGSDTITTGTGDDIVFGDQGRVDYFNEDGAIVTRLGDAPSPILGFVTEQVTPGDLMTLTDAGNKKTDDGSPVDAMFPTQGGFGIGYNDDIGLRGLFVDVNNGQGFLQKSQLITSNTGTSLTLAPGFDDRLDLPGPVFGDASEYRISTIPEDQTDGVIRPPT